MTNHFPSLSDECMQGESLMSQHHTVGTLLRLCVIKAESIPYRNALKPCLQNVQTSVFVFGKTKTCSCC
jgi:hypothetical protein